MAERDRFVLFADVTTGNPALMVLTTLTVHWWFIVWPVPPFPFTTLCSSKFLELSSLLLVLIILYLPPLVAGVVMEIDGWYGKGRFSTLCTVNVAHAFASGIAACVVFAFFSASILFGRRRLVVACSSCSQFTVVFVLVGVMTSCARLPNFWQLKHS